MDLPPSVRYGASGLFHARPCVSEPKSRRGPALLFRDDEMTQKSNPSGTREKEGEPLTRVRPWTRANRWTEAQTDRGTDCQTERGKERGVGRGESERKRAKDEPFPSMARVVHTLGDVWSLWDMPRPDGQ